MCKSVFRTAATIAALTILVGLTTPVASQAASPVRNQTVEVEAAQAASPAGLWQSLVGFWEGLVASVFAGSGGGGGEDQGGEEDPLGPPEGGGNENNNENESDENPSIDPDG